MKKMQNKKRKAKYSEGIAIYMAVTITAALVLVSFSVINLVVKQIGISGAARESQAAFYAADSGIECALYWDLKQNVFGGGEEITDGLVSYWTLDEASGTTITDSSGSTNTGTFVGSINSVSGHAGNAINFNGSGNYIFTSNQVASPGPDAYTISAWFKVEPTDDLGHKIVGYEDPQSGTSSGGYDRHLYMGTNGRIYFGWYPSGFELVASAGSLNDGNWHHAVGTHDGSVGTLYVDGTFQGTSNSGPGYPYAGWWRIGGYGLSGWTNADDGYFEGSLDEVKIFNRALSLEEVQTLYTGASGGGPVGPVTCSNNVIPVTTNGLTSTFQVTFSPEPYCADVTVIKGGATTIESRGYNTCDTGNARRVERAIKVTY